jgi:adenosine deaminase
VSEPSEPLAASTPVTRHDLWALPKVDLHRHLEGSLRLETLAEIAREHGVDLPSQTLEELRPYVQVTNDTPDFLGFLEKFELLRRFYRTPEAIARLAYEAVADAAADNVQYLELRFNPEALAHTRRFTLEAVTDWVIDAVARAQIDRGIVVRLITTIKRGVPLETAWAIARIAIERRARGVVGLDLAGDERNVPAAPYAPVFRAAKEAGLGVTVHAGEGAGAESVRAAIEELGADRLGHGVRAIEDSSVARLVRERRVTLEVCLTSNLQTGVVRSLLHHPLADLLYLELPVTLNTDDPSVSDTTLTDEYQLALEALRLPPARLGQLIEQGVQAAFLPEAERAALSARIRPALVAARFL